MIQAEIDAAAELIDFFRFNAKFAVELEGEQPISVPPSTNSVVYRGLEVPAHAGQEGPPAAVGSASPPPLSPGLRGGHLPLQLHCDRRQPGGGAGLDGEMWASGGGGGSAASLPSQQTKGHTRARRSQPRSREKHRGGGSVGPWRLWGQRLV